MALFMEFVGHECTEADSLKDALALLAKKSAELVLADAGTVEEAPEQIIRSLKGVSPSIEVMILADEASTEILDEVITSPLTSVQGIASQFTPVRKHEAFLVLLPEQDSLKMLPDLPQSPGLLNKLALLHQSQQKYNAAQQLYQRALELSEKLPGDHGREVSSILMNLADLYQDESMYAKAEPLYRRSLELAEKVYGASHPKVARRLRRLAEIYRLQGKEKEAAPVRERLSRIK